MAILVIGGAGFLGSHIAARLIKQGESVIVMDSMHPDSAHRKKNLTELSSLGRFYFHEADVSDMRAVLEVFGEKKIDRVCHFQEFDGGLGSFKYAVEAHQRRLTGMLNICEAAVRARSGNLLFASGAAVYGGASSKHGRVSEEMAPENPETLEALLYRSLEQTAHAYHKQYGLRCAGFRIFPMYGPRSEQGNPASGILNAAVSGYPAEVEHSLLECEMDWTYVADIAGGIIAAIDKEFGYEIFNLGSGVPVGLPEFIDKAETVLGRKISLKVSDSGKEPQNSFIPDIGKARKVLAYSPKISIREGIKRYAEWYQAQKQHKYF